MVFLESKGKNQLQRHPQVMISDPKSKEVIDNGPGPGQNYREMAVNGRFYALPKSRKRAENPFFSKITPKIGQKTDIYLGKGYFFLCTTLPGRS